MNNDSQKTASVSKPTHELISARAQSIWTAEGRPEGRDEEIWLQAEKQLYDESREVIPASSEAPIEPPAGGPQSSGAKPSVAASAATAATTAAPKKPASSAAADEQMISRTQNPTTGKSSSGKKRSSGR
ncbi:MAG TPA: DUF2934 domain-containing protein [Opitutaceae bacterium]|nr:DUF2934 domain-containing protein [Opitutaceae bacterium]